MNKTLKKLYNLLNFRQKLNFFFVLMIMIASAVLAQITPKAIGWLTDDILIQEQISFDKIVPILLIILAVNVINQLIIILRRIIVEDTATQTEKKARGIVISSLLKASLNYFKTNMTGNIHGRLNRCLDGTVKLEKLILILSRLVDTFISRISLTMLPVPNPHNTVCVLSWEEARHWQSRSSGYSSS